MAVVEPCALGVEALGVVLAAVVESCALGVGFVEAALAAVLGVEALGVEALGVGFVEAALAAVVEVEALVLSSIDPAEPSLPEVELGGDAPAEVPEETVSFRFLPLCLD